MTEASKEDLKPTAAAKAPVGGAEAATAAAAETPVAASAPPAKGGPGPGVATIGIDDFTKPYLRVGKVVACEFVEGSDQLLRFELHPSAIGKRPTLPAIPIGTPPC